MKSYGAPTLILLGILAASILNCCTMQKQTSRWEAQIQSVEAAAISGNWDSAETALADSYADWLTHQTYLHIVTEHAAVDGADVLYRRCAAFIAEKDLCEFRSEAAGLCHQLRLLAEMEEFSIRNIL